MLSIFYSYSLYLHARVLKTSCLQIVFKSHIESTLKTSRRSTTSVTIKFLVKILYNSKANTNVSALQQNIIAYGINRL